MQETVTTLSGSHIKDREVEGKLLSVGGKKREGGGMITIQFAYMKLFKV